MARAKNKTIARRGLMLVLSSPSGAGKTTLSRMLIEHMSGLKMSVSATTRPMRPGEVEGRDYLFVDKSRFEEMTKQDELLEWATVFDNRYGTPRAPVEAALSAGQDVLFDIDWQGTQQMREKARADVVSVFILPPSAADLEKMQEKLTGGRVEHLDRQERGGEHADLAAELAHRLRGPQPEKIRRPPERA